MRKSHKGPAPRDLGERFWEKVARRGPDECWEWQAFRNKKGYGKMLIGSRADGTNRKEYTHRIAWLLTHGKMPSDCVLHRCDNPPCCNPNHLFEGSRMDNSHDALAKGRLRVGERHQNAKLTVSAVREARADYARGGVTIRALAARYGVTEMTIHHALRGHTWKVA